jgi:hypothetical protein
MPHLRETRGGRPKLGVSAVLTRDLAGARARRAKHRLMARGGSYRPGISPGTEPSVPRTVSWLRGEWPFELFGSAITRQVQRWVVERLRRGPLHVPRSRVSPGSSHLCQTGERTLPKENCGSRKKEQATRERGAGAGGAHLTFPIRRCTCRVMALPNNSNGDSPRSHESALGTLGSAPGKVAGWAVSGNARLCPRNSPQVGRSPATSPHSESNPGSRPSTTSSR